MAPHALEIPLTKSKMPLRQTIALVDLGGLSSNSASLNASSQVKAPFEKVIGARIDSNTEVTNRINQLAATTNTGSKVEIQNRRERCLRVDSALRRLDGLTLLERCVRRLSESAMIDAIVITGAQQHREKIRTTGLGDARWVPSAFRTPGERALEISERFQAQWVIFASPLCPFTDPTLLDRLIATGWSNPESDIVEYLATSSTQACTDSLGLVHEMCSIHALEKLRDKGVLSEECEVPELWRKYPDMFLTKYLPLPHELDAAHARFRVETVEDWDRATRVLEATGDDFCWRRLVDVASRLD